MPIQQRKLTIRINNRYNASDRVSIARDVIRFIKDRTNSGIGVTGKPNSTGTHRETKKFNGYTSDYIKSKKFLNAGKNPTQVNLQLSKRMIGNLKLLKHGTGFIEVGYERGSKDNAKAEGNIIGSYGGSPKKSRERNFLGVTENELTNILIKHPLPGDDRFSALALAGILLAQEDTEDKEFFTELELQAIRGE